MLARHELLILQHCCAQLFLIATGMVGQCVLDVQCVLSRITMESSRLDMFIDLFVLSVIFEIARAVRHGRWGEPKPLGRGKSGYKRTHDGARVAELIRR